MDNYCKTCLHDGVGIGFCDKCYYNHILEEKGIPPTKYEAKPKPITNADKIRAMTDEELAEFLLNRDLDVIERASKTVGFTYKINRESSLANVIDWLRQEVNE